LYTLLALVWLYSPRQPPYDFKLLKGAKLKRLNGEEEGKSVAGEDLWRNAGAVVMVVRRPG